MALESLTGSSVYIDDLVNTNPVGATDPKSQGDDHIRGVKNVLLNTFPNLTGAVTSTQTELNLTDGMTAVLGGSTQFDALPDGTVAPFFQAAAPTGWTKSAANNDKALRVVSGTGGGSGGTHGLTAAPSTAHTHTGPSHTHTGPSHTHTTASHALSAAEMPVHTHTLTTRYGITVGGSATTALKCELNTEANPQSTATTPVTAANAGSGSAHEHGATGAGGTGATGAGGTGATGSTSPTAFAPQYVDVILCAKDAA